MDPSIYETDDIVVTYESRQKEDVLRVVITDGSSDLTLCLLYRILYDEVFGPDQSISISVYELPEKAVFLDSVAIELTFFSPNLLHDIKCSSDASVAFKDADVVLCTGTAREHAFSEQEYKDIFFQEYIHTTKTYGQFIEKYAKKDARIITLGNTSATVISRFAKSIPRKNITSVTFFNVRITTAEIAAKMDCHPRDIKNIIVWGNNNWYCFPDCEHMYLTNGKEITDELRVWLRDELPSIVQNVLRKPIHMRSLAYGFAEHCKRLWNGTPEGQWFCMGVLSDYSYGIPAGIFFCYPVYCKNKEYQIVQDLVDDQYVKRYILDICRLTMRDIKIALDQCGSA